MDKQIIVRLSTEDRKDLKRLCLEKDISVQSLILGFIEGEIKKFKGKTAPKRKKKKEEI